MFGNRPARRSSGCRGQARQLTRWEALPKARLAAAAVVFSGPLIGYGQSIAAEQGPQDSGRALYEKHCLMCHGRRGEGAPDVPLLNDGDWLYGGSLAKIEETIKNGRKGAMTAHKDTLSEREIDQLTRFVVELAEGGKGRDAGWKLFREKGCKACHGAGADGVLAELPDGSIVTVGAANLTDDMWRFRPGGYESARYTILYGVNQTGVVGTRKADCPGIGTRRSQQTSPHDFEDIKKLALYVKGLARGDTFATQEQSTSAAASGRAQARMSLPGLDTNEGEPAVAKSESEVARAAGEQTSGPFTFRVRVTIQAEPGEIVAALKSAATERSLLFVGESPYYQLVQALTGEQYRYVNFLSLQHATASKALLDQSDEFAAYLPIRIAVVESTNGELWLHTLDLESVLKLSGVNSPSIEDVSALQQQVIQMMKDVADGDF